MKASISSNVQLSGFTVSTRVIIVGAVAVSLFSLALLHISIWPFILVVVLIGSFVSGAVVLSNYSEARAAALMGATESQIAALASRADRVTFRANSVLFRQDMPADRLYLVVRGEVEVLRRDSAGVYEPIGVVGAGKWLGEVGLLGRTTRSVAAKAITDVEALALDREVVAALIGSTKNRRVIEIVSLLPAALGRDMPTRLPLLRDALRRTDGDTARWLLGAPMAQYPY